MKELAIALCFVLVLSLTGLAQAETRLVTMPELKSEYDYDGDGVVDETTYHVEMIVDGSEWATVLTVDKNVFEAVLEEQEREQEAYDGLWYVQTCRWVDTAANDVVDWIVFWD